MSSMSRTLQKPDPRRMLDAGAMRDVRALGSQRLELIVIEVDAMGIENVRADELASLHQLNGTDPVVSHAVLVLVRRLRQVRVEAHAVPARKPGGLQHELLTDGKRAAGGQHDLPHGARRRVVVGADGPLAVCEDRLLVLHHGVRREPPVFPAQAHGAARRRETHAKLLRRLELQAREIVMNPAGIEVQVIRGAGAAGLQQLSHGEHG